MVEIVELTGKEMRGFRSQLGLTQEQFGLWLQQRTFAKKAYEKQTISAFENGREPIPAKVELEILKYVLKSSGLSLKFGEDQG